MGKHDAVGIASHTWLAPVLDIIRRIISQPTPPSRRVLTLAQPAYLCPIQYVLIDKFKMVEIV